MLIVEDGSIVPDADSFLSLADARALAAKYGYSLPEDDTAAEAALRNGAMYIGLQEDALCGSRVSAAQELAFPRKGVNKLGIKIDSTSIPKAVLLAQMAAAVEYGSGTDVRASSDGRIVTEERVEGAVTVQYAATAGLANTGAEVTITKAMDALAPFLCGLGGGSDNNGCSFRVVRV